MTQLNRLFKVTETVLNAKKAKLAVEVRKEKELRAVLVALDMNRKKISRETNGVVDFSQGLGAELRWQKWAEQRRTLINNEIAASKVVQSKLQHAVAISFGKRQAVLKLMENQKSDKSTMFSSF